MLRKWALSKNNGSNPVLFSVMERVTMGLSKLFLI